MGANRVDQETGEILENDDQPEKSVDYAAMLVQSMTRNERLQARQDNLLDENKRLREEIARQRTLYSEAKSQFHAKLADAQAEFEAMKRDNNASFKAKNSNAQISIDTASMEAAMEAIGTSLSSRGIGVRQPVVDHPTDSKVSIVRTILSCGGYEESHDISIRSAYSYSQAGHDIKQFGSEVSLVRKYGLFAALGLVQETKEPPRGRHGNGSSGYQASEQRAPAGQGRQPQAADTQGQPQRNADTRQHSDGFSAAQIEQAFSAAATIQELSKAMNAIPAAERSKATALFNERRMQLQGQPMAA